MSQWLVQILPVFGSFFGAIQKITVSSVSISDTDEGPTNYTIRGELTPHATTFLNNDSDLSVRPRTTNLVSWMDLAAWSSGDRGADQLTPDLKSIVQEIGDEELKLELDVVGDLVNQPPTANAGPDRAVECNTTGSAVFTLNGAGSSDPDPAPADIALVSWRQGTRIGPEVGFGLVSQQSLAVGASENYVLRVIDSFGQADEDATTITAEDTTVPEISCNVPVTIDPTDAAISFTATAVDICDSDVTPQILSFDCFAYKGRDGKINDKTDSCVVVIDGNTVTVHDTGGVGDHISWVVDATDDSGNSTRETCEVEVVRPTANIHSRL